jgi:hypothetical protein
MPPPQLAKNCIMNITPDLCVYDSHCAKWIENILDLILRLEEKVQLNLYIKKLRIHSKEQVLLTSPDALMASRPH